MYIRLIIFLILSVSIVGCGPTHLALAPKTNETPTKPIIDGMGELVIYRVSTYGILKTPYLAANAQVFGQCSYKKAIYKALEPGLQTISVGSNKFDINIVEGQRTYASCIPWELKIVDSAKGSEVVKKLERINAF